MRASLLAAALVAACTTPVRADAMPDWLEGTWVSCAGGVKVSEAWTGAGSGMLAGVNFTHAAPAPQFEFLRIGPGADGLSFFGSPGGAPPVEFPMIAQTGQRVVFESPTHDFPQRVIYRKSGEGVFARIEGIDKGKERSEDYPMKSVPCR